MNVSGLIVFLSFFLLGTILTVAITNYWSAEKLNLLDARAKNIASYISGKIAVNEPFDKSYRTTYILNDKGNIETTLSFLAGEVNGDIAITDTSGRPQIVVNSADSINKLPGLGQRLEDEESGDTENSGEEQEEKKNEKKENSTVQKDEGNITHDDREAPPADVILNDRYADRIKTNSLVPSDVISTTISDGRYFARTTLEGI